MFTFLALICFIVTIVGITWWVRVIEEQKALEKRTVREPLLSEGGNDQTHYGRVLTEVRCKMDGERIDLRWQFQPEQESKGFFLSITCQDDGGTWRETHPPMDKSGFCQDRMKYGNGRVYRFVVVKQYTAFWGLAPAWFKIVIFDSISIAVRSGHIREGIEHGEDVAKLDGTKIRIMEARANLIVAETEIPLRTEKRLQALGNQPRSEARNGQLTITERSAALIDTRKAMATEIAKVKADPNLSEEEKEEAVIDVTNMFEEEIQRLKSQ